MKLLAFLGTVKFDNLTQYILLLVAFGFNSCSEDNTKEYYSDGGIKAEYRLENNQLQGLVLEYHENGAKKSESYFIAGRQDGLTKMYHKNGLLFKQMYFQDGVQEDTMKIYFENGKLREVSVVEAGKRSGLYREYYDNGVIQSVGLMRAGNQVDYWRSYNVDGIINEVCFYSSKDKNCDIDISDYVLTDFQSAKGDFVAKFPSQWITKANYKGAEYISVKPSEDESFAPSINIVVGSLPDNVNFEGFITSEIKDLQGLDGFNLNRVDSSDIGGNRAVKLMYDVKIGELTIHSFVAYIAHNHQIYLITCLAEKQNAWRFLDLYNILISSLIIPDHLTLHQGH